MSDCLFCKIINKEIPADIVYEDEQVIAFNDINPVSPVHVLIIPKEHIENIGSLNESNINFVSSIHFAANKIAKELKIYDNGFRLITNTGVDGGQTVFHLHYHLLGGKNLGNIL